MLHDFEQDVSVFDACHFFVSGATLKSIISCNQPANTSAATQITQKKHKLSQKVLMRPLSVVLFVVF